MANRAFNAAQCTDPSYIEAWIGQATIAEMFAHHEAMDLYRHSNELGSHVCGHLYLFLKGVLELWQGVWCWRVVLWVRCCECGGGVVWCSVVWCGVVWCDVM